MVPSVGIEQSLQALQQGDWEACASARRSKPLELSMPKFEVANTLSLRHMLESMGMKRAFSPEAQFGGISTTFIDVDQVCQSARLKIDEEGAEGAAVTFISDLLADGPGQEPDYEPFIVDRPFIYAITEQSTGAIIFAGYIQRP